MSIVLDLDAEDATVARSYFTSGTALGGRSSSKKPDEGMSLAID